MKNPVVAALLNIIPGLGYIYVGRRKAFGIIIIIFLIIAVTAQEAYDRHLLVNLGEEAISVPIDSEIGKLGTLAVSMLPILIGAFMYDAYQDARRLNSEKAKAVED